MRLGPLGIGLPELLVILIIALLIFGPKTLPKLGSALGKSVKGLREGIEGKLDDDEGSEKDEKAKEIEETTKSEE